MDESNAPGRNTPGVGSKPTTPVPQQPPPPPVPNASSSSPASMSSSISPSSSMAQIPTSHGARYGYSQMHGPYGSMGPQSNHAGMGHHSYPPGSYGPGHQMHPQQHGGQYMPMMMPPPSQYPNKPPMSHAPPPSQPPPGNPGGPPPPHVPMMASDRNSMSYYGSRLSGPPPPHHGPPPIQSPYYLRHQMPQQPTKNYYPSSGTPGLPYSGHGPGGMPSSMMMPGQHPSHLLPHQQHQHSSGPMMMHHHPSMTGQMQQHAAGYASHGSHSSVESSAATSTTTSVTHTTATSGSTNHSNGNLRHPQPPSIMDEVSQTSTASSQAAEDSCASTDMPNSHKQAKHHLSHPPTPNTSNLGSPGAASLSSFHDDFDSVSSPSWPRTPASPALNSSQYDSHAHTTKRPDSVQKLYEMSDEPERKSFLDQFLQFQEDRGTPLNQVPTISKIPLDLYRLYISVKERGGFVEVTRAKLWKECAQLCNIANSSSAAYTLRKQYMKHLLHFECKFDRGGIDPGPVLSSLESSNSSSRKKANNAKLSGSGQSNPTTPRLSPNDPSGPPYHMTMPISGGPPHSGYEQVEQHGSYPPNASTPGATAANQHSGPPFHPQAQYHHSEYQYPPHAGSTPGHMPPPATPSQHSNMSQNSLNSSQSQSQSTTATNHESVSVKDPFADDDSSSASTSTTSTISSSSTFPARPHYSMPPNSSSPYFNQMPPSTQSQSQSHPPANSYPDTHQPPPSHYPDGQFSRSPGAAPTTSEAVTNSHHSQYTPYSSRTSSGINGPSHHGYYGPYPQQTMPPSSTQQGPQQSQQLPYDQQPQQQPSANPTSQLHPRGPYDPHQRPMGPSHEHYPHPPHPHNSSSHHRYSLPNNVPHAPTSTGSGAYGPIRTPYSSGVSSGQSHHATPSGIPPPPPHHQNQQPPQTQTSQSTSGAQVPFSSASSQEGYSKNTETSYNNAIRMQSPLAQRLLAAKVSQSSTQSFSSSQFTTTVSSSNTSAPPAQSGSVKPSSSSTHHNTLQQQANSNISWMSTPSPRYSQPKRHPDFAKQGSEHYSSHPYSQSPYSNFPPSSSGPRPVSTGQPGMWSREGTQYRMSYMPGHPAFSGSSSNREPWHESRGSVPTTNATSTGDSPSTNHWSSNRYPGYPMNDYGGGSHSSHYSHSSSHSKMMHNPMMNYGLRHDQPGSRSNYIPQMMQSSHGNHPSSKVPMISSSHSSTSHSMQGPHGSFGSYTYHSNLPPHLSSSYHSMMRREIIFPPNSVEATVPTATKRRKLTARDISPVEAWRVYMALKSGLLAESAFALDVLNIYSNDDSTLIYLGLPNMPGMLEVLLEHYKCYLNEMFDNLFDDTEIGYEAKQLRYEIEEKYPNCRNGSTTVLREERKTKKVKKWYELSKDISDCEVDMENNESDDVGEFMDKQFKSRTSPQQIVLLNTTNYTHVTRTGQQVKLKKTKNLFITDYGKKWDQIKNGFASGYEHWARGGGETTSHIQSHLEPKENYLRLVRVIKSEKNKSDNEVNGFYSDNSAIAENSLNGNSGCDQSTNNGDLLNGNSDKKKSTNTTSTDNQNKDKNGDALSGQSVEQLSAKTDQYPKIRSSDRERYWKRIHQPEYEEESYDQEEPTVCIGRDYQDSIKSRCLTVSNLIRNLTFVPGNDLEMCKHPGLLLVLSRLILLHHVHALKKKRKISEIDCTKLSANKLDEETLFNLTNDEKDRTPDNEKLTEKEWWWDSLHIIRENTMVTLANLSGQLDLSTFPEQITLTILDGLLHWAVCPSSYAQDSLPSAHSSLSPKRLAYETLSKLSIFDANVDLILATPPWSRIEKFFGNLSRSLGRHEEQTIREFSVVLLSNFAGADAATSRTIALTGCTIPLLISFIEQAEQSALHVANTQGIQALRENPELMGTTLDMVRRAAATLRSVARVTENRSFFIQYEQRLLSLVMSQILDQSVATIIADVLYECSYATNNNNNGGSSSSNNYCSNNSTTTIQQQPFTATATN